MTQEEESHRHISCQSPAKRKQRNFTQGEKQAKRENSERSQLVKMQHRLHKLSYTIEVTLTEKWQ